MTRHTRATDSARGRLPRGDAVPAERLPGDAGSASLWGIALLMPVVLAVVAATATATAVIARQRVTSAADLVALAAARRLPAGSVVACDWAAWVARANEVGLRSCDCDALACQVTTTLPLPHLGGLVAVGRARAGAA